MSRRKLRSGASDADSEQPLYKLSDTVLCDFDGQLYDTIILDIKHVDVLKKEKAEAEAAGTLENSSDDPFSVRSMSTENGTASSCPDHFAYYLHYKNWNSGWDEWVRSDCLMAITEEARKQQLELKLAARKGKIKRVSSKKRRRRVKRKSAASLSQDDAAGKGLANARKVFKEEVETQEAMDDSTSQVDDACTDEDELANDGETAEAEDMEGPGNLDDSTYVSDTSVNVGAVKTVCSNENPTTDVHKEKSFKSEKCTVAGTSLPDPYVSIQMLTVQKVQTDEPNTKQTEMEITEKLGTSERQPESTSSTQVRSKTTVEVRKRALRSSTRGAVKSTDRAVTPESMTSSDADLGLGTKSGDVNAMKPLVRLVRLENKKDSADKNQGSDSNDKNASEVSSNTTVEVVKRTLRSSKRATRKSADPATSLESMTSSTASALQPESGVADSDTLKQQVGFESQNDSADKNQGSDSNDASTSSLNLAVDFNKFWLMNSSKSSLLSEKSKQPNESTPSPKLLLDKEDSIILGSEEKEQEKKADSRPSGTANEHPCSLLGTPTVNDVLPKLQDYLCSMDSISDVTGSAFVEKLRLMYEIFCKVLVSPAARQGAEQIMKENMVSSFGSIAHFSGLLKLISVLESGDLSNMEYYKLKKDAIIS